VASRAATPGHLAKVEQLGLGLEVGLAEVHEAGIGQQGGEFPLQPVKYESSIPLGVTIGARRHQATGAAIRERKDFLDHNLRAPF